MADQEFIERPETEYLRIPSATALEEESHTDPTFPANETRSPVPRRGVKSHLTPEQQIQIAVWIVEGYPYREAKQFMQRDWGFSVSDATWGYYRNVRTDLLDAAARFVSNQYMQFGYANAAVQVNKLSKHLQRIERIMETRGLFATDTKVLGYGKSAQVVSSEIFDKALSQEYRETMAAIRKIKEPVEQRLAEAEARTRLPASPQQTERFLQAAQASLVGSAVPIEEGEQGFSGLLPPLDPQ